MGDTYCCYEELRQNEVEGRDYRVVDVTKARDPRVVVMAPHGGGIEPGTSQIAGWLAGDEFVLYIFEGRKKRCNAVLHITSTSFDEPRATAVVHRAAVVLAVHGACGDDEFVMVGGRHRDLVSAIKTYLNAIGIQTRDPGRHLAARDSGNICNRSQSGRGAQLEISRGLRDALLENEDRGRQLSSGIRSLLQQSIVAIGGSAL